MIMETSPSEMETQRSCRPESLREGDIYFWRWKDGQSPKLLGSSDYAYWCKSQKAIVRKGLLIDTYWTDMSSDRAIDPERVELEYKGNESELRRISEEEISYHLWEDVVDMRHANDSRAGIFVKPGAVRSAARIMEFLRYRRERREADIRYANNDIERIDKALARVQAGDVGGYFP